MLVDILNNILIIDGSSSIDLKPNQISQLFFWGFTPTKDHQSYQLVQEKIESVLPKLLKYFDREGISYNVSATCKECIEKQKDATNAYNFIIDIGRKYKQGDFDKKKYSEFRSFILANIPRKLKDHQIKAAFHLYLIWNGANFSVPGSGKTAVVCTVYEKLRSEGKVNLIFVVGPPACFEPWRDEFELTLGRKPDYKILAGGDQGQRKLEYYNQNATKPELYCITYQTLCNDQEEVIKFFSQSDVKALLVIDEAHYIKQIGGVWAQAVLRISEYAKYRCILTGTPMPHNYSDVFNQLDFLWPNNNPLDQESKIKIDTYQNNNDLDSAKKIIEEKMSPLFYRVRKSDLHLIPPNFHPPYYVPMNKYEKILYAAIENRIRDYSKKDYLKNIDLVLKLARGRIIRLRQCVSYPKLLTTALENYSEGFFDGEIDLMQTISNYDSLERPAKLDYLTELVSEFQKKNLKVLIWAHFRGTLELIINHLSQKGYLCKLIYGATPTEKTLIGEEETREKIRSEFIDPNSNLNILVANPAACGESISLHKTCYHAIYYDLSYNCAQYLQSLDRIHRIGGSEINQANYYYLQYKDSIDEDILSNLMRKSARMHELIEQEYGIYSLDMFEEDDDIAAYNRLFGAK